MTAHSTPEMAINFTDSAAHKVGELIREEDNLALKLRVYITGGGCSGFQYGFTFDEAQNDDDMVLAKQVELADFDMTEVVLLIDAMSYQYLQGSEIDYQENLHGAQFVIRNPNAKTTCGCGSSFAIED